jgi:hypothetical protein
MGSWRLFRPLAILEDTKVPRCEMIAEWRIWYIYCLIITRHYNIKMKLAQLHGKHPVTNLFINNDTTREQKQQIRGVFCCQNIKKSGHPLQRCRTYWNNTRWWDESINKNICWVDWYDTVLHDLHRVWESNFKIVKWRIRK